VVTAALQVLRLTCLLKKPVPLFLTGWKSFWRARMANKARRGVEYTCVCNCVTEAEIRQAVRDGHRTLEDIQNYNFATVGPCGGSCLARVMQILSEENEK
jgi:bacterioferritin-associated ferredoxin